MVPILVDFPRSTGFQEFGAFGKEFEKAIQNGKALQPSCQDGASAKRQAHDQSGAAPWRVIAHARFHIV